SDDGIKGLSRLNPLRVHKLYETKTTEWGLHHLAGMKLHSLVIPYSARTELGVQHYLAALDSPSSLSFSLWGISDRALKHLAGLDRLQALDLSFTKITEEGLKELAGLKELQHLNLTNTRINGDGLKYLAGLTKLRTLNLN